MLDVHRLRVLRTVVATGSVGAAATTLGYTPSAVSQHLATLQRETGLLLIERKGRGIEPTAAGRTLAEEAGRVLESLSGVEGVVGDLRAGRVGRLSISYFASAGAAWIPPVVAGLMHEFPDLRLDLRLIELLGDEHPDPDIEIFVGGAGEHLRAPGGNGQSKVHHLLDDPYVVVVPADHPLAAAPHVALGALATERWVDNDFNRGFCRQVILDSCTEAGFTPDFRIETHDYPTAISFVAAGVGVTVLPSLGAAQLPAGVVAISLVSPTPVRHVYVAVKASVEHHPAARRAVDLLRERVSAPARVGA
jgi:DNA-binding transcriptional LysR family regulator